MSDLIKAVENGYPPDCIVEACEENDCSVDLAGAPAPNMIIDFDKAGSRGVRCDFLFVSDEGRGWVVPLELTSGTSKPPSKVIDQLGAGARSAAALIPAGGDLNFIPVFVGEADRHMKSYLRSNQIRFHRKKALVQWIDCGERLSDVLR